MEFSQPADEHKRLEKLIGNWAGPETMSPSPWDPEGGTAEGRITNKGVCAGFGVVQDYEQIRDGAVSFSGHGIFTWEASQKRYMMHWWDSMGFPPNVFSGDFEGDVLIMQCEGPEGHHRVSVDLSKDNAYEFKMEVSSDGAKWDTFLVGSYVRQA